MLPPIDRTNRIHAIASVIRRAVAQQRNGQSGSIEQPASAPADADRMTVLLSRAKAIPADHPNRPRQALRLFIETVLLNEFGVQLSTDAAFQNLIDDVVDALGNSNEYGQECREIGLMLLGESRS